MLTGRYGLHLVGSGGYRHPLMNLTNDTGSTTAEIIRAVRADGHHATADAMEKVRAELFTPMPSLTQLREMQRRDRTQAGKFPPPL